MAPHASRTPSASATSSCASHGGPRRPRRARCTGKRSGSSAHRAALAPARLGSGRRRAPTGWRPFRPSRAAPSTAACPQGDGRHRTRAIGHRGRGPRPPRRRWLSEARVYAWPARRPPRSWPDPRRRQASPRMRRRSAGVKKGPQWVVVNNLYVAAKAPQGQVAGGRVEWPGFRRAFGKRRRRRWRCRCRCRTSSCGPRRAATTRINAADRRVDEARGGNANGLTKNSL